jgi:hypothetical protein
LLIHYLFFIINVEKVQIRILQKKDELDNLQGEKTPILGKRGLNN